MCCWHAQAPRTWAVLCWDRRGPLVSQYAASQEAGGFTPMADMAFSIRVSSLGDASTSLCCVGTPRAGMHVGSRRVGVARPVLCTRQALAGLQCLHRSEGGRLQKQRVVRAAGACRRPQRILPDEGHTNAAPAAQTRTAAVATRPWPGRHAAWIKVSQANTANTRNVAVGQVNA